MYVCGNAESITEIKNRWNKNEEMSFKEASDINHRP